MTWLNDAMTTWQRDMVSALLPTTCIISAPTVTKDSAGANVYAYAAVAGGTVSCRLDPLGNSTAREVGELLGRETLNRARFLTVPYDAPLAIDYQITINSTIYQIVQLVDDQSAKAVQRAIVARLA